MKHRATKPTTKAGCISFRPSLKIKRQIDQHREQISTLACGTYITMSAVLERLLADQLETQGYK